MLHQQPVVLSYNVRWFSDTESIAHDIGRPCQRLHLHAGYSRGVYDLGHAIVW